MTAEEIQHLVGGELRGEGSRRIERVAPLERADPEALSFVASAKYLTYLQATRAGVVLVNPEWLDSVPAGTVAIAVGDPHQALRTVLLRLHPPERPAVGIHPEAVVAASARVAADASVGPGAVVDEQVEIGSRSALGAHVVVGRGCRVGQDVTIHPHATLYPGVVVRDRVVVHSGARIGADGFGYVWNDGAHRKVPQVGGCILEEDVEIGANSTIDRGSIGDTVIGKGTKIDNLVHVGHNAEIGSHVILIAQVGISGSTRVGDGAILGGQVGVAGHLTIGPGARLGAQAGVISDIPAGETFSGYPARPHREAMRAQAGLFKLPEMLRRLRRLEERIFGRGPQNDHQKSNG
jgi:UDP-3-O-[3-hydroxymyristoyl] glucosamine N-acyltransferase